MCVEGERLVVNVHVMITVLLYGMGTKAQINTIEWKWQVEQSAIDHMTPVCRCHDITVSLSFVDTGGRHACNSDLCILYNG